MPRGLSDQAEVIVVSVCGLEAMADARASTG
jgi:hypothetical protein